MYTRAQHVSEWNLCMVCTEQDTPAGAAATANILIRMASAGVRAATFYPTCAGGEGRTGTGWGLFDQESAPGHALWRKQTYAYGMASEVLESGAVLLPGARPSGRMVVWGSMGPHPLWAPSDARRTCIALPAGSEAKDSR